MLLIFDPHFSDALGYFSLECKRKSVWIIYSLMQDFKPLELGQIIQLYCFVLQRNFSVCSCVVRLPLERKTFSSFLLKFY